MTAVVSAVGRYVVGIDADAVDDIEPDDGGSAEALDVAAWLGERVIGRRLRLRIRASGGLRGVIVGERVDVVEIVPRPIPEAALRFSTTRAVDTLFEHGAGFGYLLAVDRALRS